MFVAMGVNSSRLQVRQAGEGAWGWDAAHQRQQQQAAGAA